MSTQISMEDAVSLLVNPQEDNPPVETLQADDDDVSQDSQADDVVENAAFDAEEGEEQFADDDDADEVEPELLDDSIEVTIDGKVEKVTRNEAAKGYQRQADYSRKTMELAKQRKAVEAEAQKITAEREQYAQALQLIQSQLSAEEQPDWNRLKDEDPFEYMVQKDAWRDKQERLAQVQAEQSRLQQQQMAEQQQAMQREIAIPSWRDQKVAETEKAAVVAYAKSSGFSDDEISNVVDARAVELLHKAWKFDQLMKDQKVDAKRVKNAPKAAKGGQPVTKKQRTSRRRQAAFDKLKTSGKIDDAVNLLLLKE
jgi:hypothetical protein